MLFNSLDFCKFLPIVFILYWFVTNKNLKAQNFLLLAASYFFYACWDIRFLFLLIFSTFLDYFTGIKMSESQTIKRKKFWFWLSITVNIGFLGVFKYYNFFAESFAEALSTIGLTVHPWTLNVILPVGISFYTFHGLSYVIDIYKDRIKAEKNIVDYSVFVSFFPLLVAGPIERATHLLPQIKKERTFDVKNIIDGCRQIAWGLFKKIIIADLCAQNADLIFNNAADHSGSTLIMGALFFTLQIYGDFSGYSDIALGTARLFGIELLKNFSFPYFSRDISEFWRRWHISLSNWFRDYLYIPLGGSKVSTLKKIRNTFIIFLVSGFWHGANWTFIIWGLLNALYIMPSIIFNTNRKNLDVIAAGKYLPSIKEIISVLITFSLTVFAWIFFRCKTVGEALYFIKKIFSSSFFTSPKIPETTINLLIPYFIFLLFFIEWIGREQEYALGNLDKRWPKYIRHLLYYFILFGVLFLNGRSSQFIYFQF